MGPSQRGGREAKQLANASMVGYDIILVYIYALFTRARLLIKAPVAVDGSNHCLFQRVLRDSWELNEWHLEQVQQQTCIQRCYHSQGRYQTQEKAVVT